MATSRRPINPSRRVLESGSAPFSSSLHSRSQSPSYLTIALIVLGILSIIYIYRGRGTSGDYGAVSRMQGDYSCTGEVHRAIPFLKTAYGDSLHKILHVGPDSCSVVSRLMGEDESKEAWGIEPYDIEDADRTCKKLVHRGLVRVADIKFPLPYRAKSFPLVIVSDSLDYLSPKYLNKTLPELARLSSDGLVIFTGYPHHHKAQALDKAKYGRSAKLRSPTWWVRFFVQMSLEENEAVVKKFEQVAEKKSYKPNCQIFHLKPYN